MHRFDQLLNATRLLSTLSITSPPSTPLNSPLDFSQLLNSYGLLTTPLDPSQLLNSAAATLVAGGVISAVPSAGILQAVANTIAALNAASKSSIVSRRERFLALRASGTGQGARLGRLGL